MSLLRHHQLLMGSLGPPPPVPPGVPSDTMDVTNSSFWHAIGSATEVYIGPYPEGWMISGGAGAIGQLTYSNSAGTPTFVNPTLYLYVHNTNAGCSNNFFNRVLVQSLVGGLSTSRLDTLGTPQPAGDILYIVPIPITVGGGTNNTIRVQLTVGGSTCGSPPGSTRYVRYLGLRV